MCWIECDNLYDQMELETCPLCSPKWGNKHERERLEKWMIMFFNGEEAMVWQDMRDRYTELGGR